MSFKSFEDIKKSLLKNPVKVLLPICIIGVITAVVPGLLGNTLKTDQQPVKKEDSTQDYVNKTEERLKDIVTKISGDDTPQVMVTLESGIEYVYARQTKSDSGTVENKNGETELKTEQNDKAEESLIIVTAEDGTETPLVVTEIMPEVKGVVISCAGGNDENVKAAVSDAVCTALDISDKRVCVIGKNYTNERRK